MGGRGRAGSYLLVIALDHPCRMTVGGLGEHTFPDGTYFYCGSALNGLRSRVARHLREEKKRHWHVDRLLEEGKAVGALLFYSDDRLECRLARSLAGMDGVLLHVPGFGSSDCRCPGHLFRADLERLPEGWSEDLLRVSSGP